MQTQQQTRRVGMLHGACSQQVWHPHCACLVLHLLRRTSEQARSCCKVCHAAVNLLLLLLLLSHTPAIWPADAPDAAAAPAATSAHSLLAPLLLPPQLLLLLLTIVKPPSSPLPSW
jgi:hypothetical protein